MRLSDLRANLSVVEKIDFVGGVYPRQHISLIASAPGTGKTWLILRHSLDLATGQPLTCTEDSEPITGKALIFCGEAGAGIIAERIRKMGYETPPENIVVYTLSSFISNKIPIHLDTPEGMSTFCRVVNGEKPALVFVDTLISFRSDDESDQKSTATMLANIRTCAEDNDCAIVLTHHLRKRKARDQGLAITQDDIIGTSAFTRLCSVAYTLSTELYSEAVTFQCVKSWWRKPAPKAFRLMNTLSAEIDVIEVAHDEETGVIEKANKILDSVGKGGEITAASLMQHAGCSKATASKVIKRAVEDRTISLLWQDGEGKHYVKTGN